MWIPLQSTGDGPKRIPVSHQPQMTQKAVVTPTPHQRVLGVSNGPLRIQRPVSHQKPVSQVSVAVKPAQPSDQNVNPATRNVNPPPQLKPSSQQNQPKTNVTQESAKPSESAKLEKPQSKCNIILGKLIKTVCVLDITFVFLFIRQTCQEWFYKRFCIKVCLLLKLF